MVAFAKLVFSFVVEGGVFVKKEFFGGKKVCVLHFSKSRVVSGQAEAKGCVDQ